jgi:hypothetical protein
MTVSLTDRIQRVLDFVLRAIGLEASSEAGRINAVGLALVFALVAVGGAANLLQALVRIVNDDYTTGAPSLIALVAILGGLMLLCVLILALVPPPPGGSGSADKR